MVIGGLIRDAKVEGESRVPVLGKIPLIGELFQVRSGTREKTNLMVFIRPKILRDARSRRSRPMRSTTRCATCRSA